MHPPPPQVRRAVLGRRRPRWGRHRRHPGHRSDRHRRVRDSRDAASRRPHHHAAGAHRRQAGRSGRAAEGRRKANRPARRDDAERPPSGAGPAADLAKALGVDAAKVQNVLEANRPAAGTRDARPAKPDHTKLVAALAAGLNLDKAKVKAALDKVHTAREAARGPARG